MFSFCFYLKVLSHGLRYQLFFEQGNWFVTIQIKTPLLPNVLFKKKKDKTYNPGIGVEEDYPAE